MSAVNVYFDMIAKLVDSNFSTWENSWMLLRRFSHKYSFILILYVFGLSSDLLMNGSKDTKHIWISLGALFVNFIQIRSNNRTISLITRHLSFNIKMGSNERFISEFELWDLFIKVIISSDSI